MLLCRYRGPNPPATSLRLAAHRVLRSTASEIVATFMRGASPLAVVDVGLSGCRLARAGGATRAATGPAGRRLLSLLASLAG